MNRNVRIARELVRLAKSIVADGKHVLSKEEEDRLVNDIRSWCLKNNCDMEFQGQSLICVKVAIEYEMPLCKNHKIINEKRSWTSELDIDLDTLQACPDGFDFGEKVDINNVGKTLDSFKKDVEERIEMERNDAKIRAEREKGLENATEKDYLDEQDMAYLNKMDELAEQRYNGYGRRPEYDDYGTFDDDGVDYDAGDWLDATEYIMMDCEKIMKQNGWTRKESECSNFDSDLSFDGYESPDKKRLVIVESNPEEASVCAKMYDNNGRKSAPLKKVCMEAMSPWDIDNSEVEKFKSDLSMMLNEF